MGFGTIGDDGAYNEPVNGWSTSGQLVAQRGETSQFSLQAVFPNSGYYTVQFGVIQPSTGNPVNPKATLRWSVEGNDITRRINVGSGVTISGPGQGVKVVVQDATPTGGAAYSDPYTVSIQVSPGARPSSFTPPTLQCELYTTSDLGGSNAGPFIPMNSGVVSIGASGVGYFVVPQDAGPVSVEVAGTNSDGTSATYIVEQSSISGVTAVDNKLYNCADVQGFVDLVPATNLVRVVNLSATLGIDVSVTFGING